MRGSFAAMTSLFLFLLAFSSLLLFAGSRNDANAPAPKNASQPPKAQVDNVVDDVHGVKIADPYRWLEDAHSPATRQFVSEQLAYTRSVLDALPSRDKLHTRLQELLEIGNVTAPKSGGGLLFLHAARGHAESASAVRSRRRNEQRSRPGGREPAGGGRNDRAGLVLPKSRRKVCCLWNLSKWVGAQHPARDRHCDRPSAAGQH